MKAAEAQKNGLLLEEITSYKTTIKNEDGSSSEVIVNHDDCI